MSFNLTILYCFVLLVAEICPGQQAADLDEFMQLVYQQRDAGYRTLEQLNFEERTTLTVEDARSGRLITEQIIDYEWFTREGRLIRSPLAVNGVAAGTREKRAYEQEWLTGGRAGKQRGALREDSFFHFDFEPGRYFMVRRFERNSRDLVEIEYLPGEHFQNNGRDPIGSQGDEYDPAFDKTSRVRYLIDLNTHQIISIEFTNSSLDYLPYGWLVKFKNLDTRITYTQLESGKWVPETLVLQTVINDADTSKKVTIERRFGGFTRPEVDVEFDVISADPEPGNN